MIKPFFIFTKPAILLTLLLSQSHIHGGHEPYGLLYLDIMPPRAEVVLDGHNLDVHVWMVSLPPGSHDLLIRKPGYKSHYQPIEIGPGQNLHLEIHLEQEGLGPYPNSSQSSNLVPSSNQELP